MGRGQDTKLSGDSGHNHLQQDLAATFGKAYVKIPEANKGKGQRRKLFTGGDRLSSNSCCHLCRNFHGLCVLCFACSKSFCERCLNLRHGENMHEVCKPEIEWVCPKCRPGCGRGCDRTCCTCSMCYHHFKKTLPFGKCGQSKGQRIIKEARSAGWNLHDYQIHLQTNESKLEIANRKLSFAWTAKTKGVTIMHSNVINKGTDHPLTKHKGPVEKERITLHQIDKTTCDKEMELDKINENHAEADHSNDDIDTSYKALRNSLIPYRDMASNTFLMSLWFNKEKDLTGNQMSITLTDGETQLKSNIEKRSLAGNIAHEFNPAKLKSQSRNEKESRKEKLKEHLGRELAEYVQTTEKCRRDGNVEDTRLSQFYEEVNQQRTRAYLDAKGKIDFYIERMKAVVEMVCTEIDTEIISASNVQSSVFIFSASIALWTKAGVNALTSIELLTKYWNALIYLRSE